MGHSEFLDKVIGHRIQKAYLYELISSGKVPNALLFTGIESIGKFLTAIEFAKSLLCQSDIGFAACENCFSCRQISKGFNPDLLVINKDKEIQIDEVRGEIAEFLSKKALYGKHKIVIINNADRINDAAANALLKNLEEPPRESTFILISSNETAILPTIRSRCQKIRFTPLSREEINTIAKGKQGLTEGSLKPVASKAGLNAAKAFFNWKPKVFSRKNAADELLGIGLYLREAMVLSLNMPEIGYNVLENVPKARISKEFWEFIDMYFDSMGKIDMLNLEILRFAMQMKARNLL